LKGTAKISNLDQPDRNDTTLHIKLRIVQTDGGKLKLFENIFLERKDIVTYVKSLTVGLISSSGKTLKELSSGLKRIGLQKIHFYSKAEQAKAAFEKERLDCLMSEWDVGGARKGFRLIQEIRALKQAQATICVLLSSQVDKDYIAEAVENDVDEFLAKPFSAHSLQESFWNGLRKRKFPSPYRLSLRSASKYIITKDFKRAQNYLQTALHQNENPTTAYYYRGYISMINGNLEEALKSYEIGLEMNGNHLKCLFGKAFLLKKEHKLLEYYETLKHILEIFPKHTNSLRDAFPLALHYDDDQYAASVLVRLSQKPSNPQINKLIKKYGALLLQKTNHTETEGSLKTVISALMQKMDVPE